MVLYFSGTGNSRWVAERLAILTGDDMYGVADVAANCPLPRALDSEEPLGVVFPVYGWMPPEVMLRALERLPKEWMPRYFYMVCTCGDDTGKTARVFSRWVGRKGWHCDAAFSVTMPNTYVCLPGFDVDAEKVEHAKLAKAEHRMEEVARWVKDRTRMTDCHEGALPWLKTYVLGWFFKRFLMSPRPFHVTDECIGCGKCERECPLHNVKMENGHPRWGKNCAMCLACYHHCPKHAVAYGRSTQGKGQYVFPANVLKAGEE